MFKNTIFLSSFTFVFLCVWVWKKWKIHLSWLCDCYSNSVKKQKYNHQGWISVINAKNLMNKIYGKGIPSISCSSISIVTLSNASVLVWKTFHYSSIYRLNATSRKISIFCRNIELKWSSNYSTRMSNYSAIEATSQNGKALLMPRMDRSISSANESWIKITLPIYNVKGFSRHCHCHCRLEWRAIVEEIFFTVTVWNIPLDFALSLNEVLRFVIQIVN